MNSRPLAVIVLLLLTPLLAFAEGQEGQADLDKALELKLSAESIKDLSEVINLSRSALAAGLDDANKEFAQKLLIGTLVQRAEIMCRQIFDQPEPPVQWPLMRRQAMLDLEEAVKLDESQFDVHYMIGRLSALPGGDRERARKALDAAIKLSSESPADEAKSLLLRANLAEDAEKRIADYNRAVELAPEEAEIVRTRGLYLLMEKKYDEALADMDKAIELEPDHADSHEARGVILFLQGKNDEAMKSFDRTIELEPKSAMTYTHRARIYAVKDEIDKATAELDKALELDPKLVTAFVLRARLHQQKGEKDAAMEDVTEALRLVPGDTQALQLRALLLAGSGKLSDAIDDLQQLRRTEPNNVELLMQLGLFYGADKQPRKAIDVFSSILKKDPDNLLALRNRGDAWLGIGKLSDAIADYESALKLEGKDSGVLNNLAWLLATSPEDKLRDGKRAIELAKEAARVTEFKQAHILSTLAASYAETGDFENAMTWSKKAVEIAETTDGNQEIRDQLKAELASYEAKKPWREHIKEVADSDDPEPEDSPSPAEEPAENEDAEEE